MVNRKAKTQVAHAQKTTSVVTLGKATQLTLGGGTHGCEGRGYPNYIA